MTHPEVKSQHRPVMEQPVLELLLQASADGERLHGIVVDGTVGGGGHARRILEKLNSAGQLYCFDRDPQALKMAEETLGRAERIRFVHDSFAEVGRHLQAATASAVLLDLGLSTDLILSSRGFAYHSESLLDMRFDPAAETTAYEVVNRYPVSKLRDIFFRYGEEPLAPRVARRIAEVRAAGAVRTTTELARIIQGAVPERFRIKALARIFQAIRIEVNQELEHLERGLEACWNVLQVGGVICALSYHSLEDRRVKRFLAAQARGCICPPRLPVCVCGRKPAAQILTPSALRPSPAEIRMNPASRSARLRAARKLASDLT